MALAVLGNTVDGNNGPGSGTIQDNKADRGLQRIARLGVYRPLFPFSGISASCTHRAQRIESSNEGSGRLDAAQILSIRVIVRVAPAHQSVCLIGSTSTWKSGGE